MPKIKDNIVMYSSLLPRSEKPQKIQAFFFPLCIINFTPYNAFKFPGVIQKVSSFPF